ncbi:proline-rich protein 15-like protein [Denticeps clupeoides]|uniref:proline-rich protein 15-like protein n=1 Tax=Denticeps clupeoides TaxID=299321 RepID=UPI0010A43C3F|nr:proline-rich protein 15 [Denticeps clupeoides]XP_028837167.1 proline-rich protein 15 [Denticeps clupeoides]
MAERYAWWRPFTLRKKSGAPSKEPGLQKEPVADAQPASEGSPGAPRTAADPQGKKDPAFLGYDTYDDAQLEPAFSESASRRNLRVSRSGRFKEKRRIRVTLPENTNFYESSAAVAK